MILVSCSDMGDPLILQPDIHVTPESLNFATVSLGENQTRDLQILNLGEGDLNLDLTLIQQGTEFSMSLSGTQIIEPGDTLLVSISFAPEASSNFVAEVNISSNDPDQNQITISLSGAGTTLPVPGLSASPTNIDFGNLLVGESALSSLTIESVGTAELVIDSILVNFTGLAMNVSTPLRLQPEETVSITLDYDATEIGNHSGTLMVYSNVSGSPELIELSAEVVSPVSYASNVQPVWNNSCSGCHGNNGGLSLASYSDLMAGNSNNGPVVVPGNGSNSLIVRKLRGTAGSLMPAGGPALSDEIIGTIEAWIDQGALDN